MVLMDALRVMVNNPFKERFYEKKKNNNNNVLTAFSFLIKIISKLS